MTEKQMNKNVWVMAAVATALSFMLVSGASLQQAFAHASAILTVEDEPVEGKKIRVTVGHTSEPTYGAKPGIHDGKHNFEASLADSETRMPLTGASLKVDKYYFDDIKSFKKAKSLKDADDTEKGVTVGSVFGDPGHYLTRQVQKDGIYGYRLYGTISYFGEASVKIDSTVFCTTPEGDTKKFNKGSWSGSFGCTEDIDDTLFPGRNNDVRNSGNNREASFEMGIETSQVQQVGLDGSNSSAATSTVAAGSPTNTSIQQASMVPTSMGLQLIMFGLPAAAIASFIGIRILGQRRNETGSL